VLRRIFGPNRDEVTGVWRKLHNEELHNLYTSPNILRAIKSRRIRWAGYVACMWERKSLYNVLVGKPERKILLGRPRSRCEDNIKTDLHEVGFRDMDWIELDKDRDRWRTFVNVVMNIRVPQNAGNFLTSFQQVIFSRTLLHGVSK
jgi:hypothetical protein